MSQGSSVASTAGPAPVRARRPAAAWVGLSLARQRLLTRPLLLLALLALVLALGVAAIERLAAPPGAADRALGMVFGLVIPLTSFAVVHLAVGRRRLAESVWCAARYGLSRRKLLIGLELGTIAVAAAIAVVVATLSLVVAQVHTAALGSDLWTTGWIAALGAAAYAACFGAGATVLRGGRGRWIPLVLDFVLGDGLGFGAALVPRSHLRNLIGGTPPLELGQASSSALLLGGAVVLVALASIRSGE